MRSLEVGYAFEVAFHLRIRTVQIHVLSIAIRRAHAMLISLVSCEASHFVTGYILFKQLDFISCHSINSWRLQDTFKQNKTDCNNFSTDNTDDVIMTLKAKLKTIFELSIFNITLQAEPAFPHSPPTSMLFFCQSVSLENSSSAWVWLFFVEHARSFHDNAKTF